MVSFVHKRITSLIKRVEFESNGMTYIILRGRWCHTIVLSVHISTKDKIYGVKDGFYEELKRAFDKFLKFHVNILLGDINAIVQSEV
jgi:hypothetical protein